MESFYLGLQIVEQWAGQVLRNRVVATRVERMATHNTAQG